MTEAWHDLGWEERKFTILEELGRVRGSLTTAAPTRVVADRIARATGWRSDDISKVLVRNFAKLPHARPAGVVKRYGRAFTRWEWLPVHETVTGQTPPDLVA